MKSYSDNGSASTFSYLATILYHIHIVSYNYGIEQLSTLEHIARSITIMHKIHKILNVDIYSHLFPISQMSCINMYLFS